MTLEVDDCSTRRTRERRAIDPTRAATTAGTGGLIATQELYRQFWSPFEPLAKQRGWTHAAASAANSWSLPTGVTGRRGRCPMQSSVAARTSTSNTRTRWSTWPGGGCYTVARMMS